MASQDKVDAARSRQMALVRSKNTKPEMTVRRLVHSMGYRYRLHAKGLPGKPDLTFGPRRAAIFVHGCFWHRHDDPSCRLSRLPRSRLDFWGPKLQGNAARDLRNVAALEAAGWRVLTIWECQMKDLTALQQRLRSFLECKHDAAEG